MTDMRNSGNGGGGAMNAFQPRRLYVHVHVRRCGGTTFWSQVLKRNFGRAFFRDPGLIHQQYNRDDWIRIVKNCVWLKAYSSHKASLDLPFDLPGLDCRAIAFVRDPVDRLLSVYFYHRTCPREWVSETRCMGLREFFEYVFEKGHLDRLMEEGPLSQLEYMFGHGGEAALHCVEQLCQAGRLFLFPVSRFDEACVVLEKLFPGDFGDCSYRKRNEALKDQVVSGEDREYIRNYVNSDDYRLLKLAEYFLDRHTAALWSDTAAFRASLADFQNRCDVLTELEPAAKPSFISAVKNVLRRALRA